jgi:hypothetical protein
MPPEPEDSTLKNRLCHGAYPTHIHKSLVFAYMGPPEKQPPFPQYDSFARSRSKYVVADRYIIPCNWLQMKDNCMDPAHRVWLHARSSGLQGDPEEGVDAEWDFLETPVGMIYIDTRRSGDYVWIRIADFIPPYIHQFPNPHGDANKPEIRAKKFRSPAERTDFAVPVDDTHTMNIAWRRVPDGLEPQRMTKGGSAPMRHYETWLQRSYEERQRTPGDYEAQTGQGPITIHAQEHLASSDAGVIMLRNLIRQGVRAVQDGGDPPGIHYGSAGSVTTYGSETYLDIPRAATPEEDRRLLRDVARKVALEFIENNVQGRDQLSFNA